MGPYIAEVAYEIVAVEALSGWSESLPVAKSGRSRTRRGVERKALAESIVYVLLDVARGRLRRLESRRGRAGFKARSVGTGVR
jgi:hypothetical protein